MLPKTILKVSNRKDLLVKAMVITNHPEKDKVRTLLMNIIQSDPFKVKDILFEALNKGYINPEDIIKMGHILTGVAIYYIVNNWNLHDKRVRKKFLKLIKEAPIDNIEIEERLKKNQLKEYIEELIPEDWIKIQFKYVDKEMKELLNKIEKIDKPLVTKHYTKTISKVNKKSPIRFLKIINIRNKRIRVLEYYGSVYSIDFSKDGKYIAAGGSQKTVIVWDLNTGIEILNFQGHDNWIRSIAFSPNGRYIVSGSDDRTIRIWDIKYKKVVQILKGHASWVTSIAFSPDGRYIASGSRDRTVRLWDVETGEVVRVFEGHNDWVTSIAFSPDGRYIASGSNDKTIRLWDVRQGLCFLVFDDFERPVKSVAFSPDGLYVAGSEGF